ncbi:WW protein [Parelaphostrongylus tenuis]|uniref:WW protein n=1 Tax=Parelaphostrongylus tenuis TaxID=148309 RepID=A0AAD5WFR7_PARTN|nr:WW protein [Parelaphostrongylus tenuis]
MANLPRPQTSIWKKMYQYRETLLGLFRTATELVCDKNDDEEEKDIGEEEEVESPSTKRPRLDESLDNEASKFTWQWQNTNEGKCPFKSASNSSNGDRSDSCSQKGLEDDQELNDEDDVDMQNLDVHDILEEAVDRIKKEADEAQSVPVVWKYVPERLEHDHFMNLPEGWTRITHNSGMPVYLHRKSRVISLSKPYFIGTQGVRDHPIPVTGIPCLHQRKINERDAALAAAETEGQQKSEAQTTLESEIKQKLIAPTVKIERQEDYLLTGEEYRKYAEKLFKFKLIQVKKFTNFKEKKAAYREKQFDQALKDSGVTLKMKDVLGKREKAPAGLALIHIESADPRFHKRSFVMNPQGKSSITVLHEYSQRALKGRTIYHIEETRNATKPFHATGIVVVKKSVRVQIAGTIKDKLALLGASNGEKDDNADEDSIIVGRGEGPSKRVAKMMAAKQALAVLIPEIRFNDDYMATIQPPDATEKNYDDQAIALFDELPIEDPRISDLSVRTCQPKPLILLKTALLRSIKLCREVPSTKVELLGPMRTRVTMTVGDLSAEVIASGSKVGQQRAAQNLLKQIHPHVSTYGGLLRIYANPDEKEEQREARRLQAELVQLQNQTKVLGDAKKAGKSKGHTSSNANSDSSKSAAALAREKAENARQQAEELKDKAFHAKELTEKLKAKVEKAKRAADRAALRPDCDKARVAMGKLFKLTDQYTESNRRLNKLKSMVDKATRRYKKRLRKIERPVEKKRWERIGDQNRNHRADTNEAVLALLRKEMGRIKERTVTRTYMYATKAPVK